MSDYTVHVVDDEPDVRGAVQLLLKSMGYTVICYENGQSFLEQFSGQGSGCIILDVRMPGKSGLAVQEALIDQGCLLPIIFMSGHGDIPMAVKAVQRGALDFLEKPFNDQALLDLVERAKLTCAQHTQTQAEISEIQQQMAELTPREKEVMQCLVEGLSNKLIARKLDVSPRTVEIHRSRVFQKMQVENAQQLVKRVVQVRSL
ncbi:response regulator transcription factor [Salinibius halmophilus]|uniref:response regulator transcription factor n=1 Tax=Salinibius halmophilus TaxID=1853216 RepID=UPI000E66BA0B|nr:response regulator [Salinibius halmophilus]